MTFEELLFNDKSAIKAATFCSKLKKHLLLEDDNVPKSLATCMLHNNQGIIAMFNFCNIKFLNLFDDCIDDADEATCKYLTRGASKSISRLVMQVAKGRDVVAGMLPYVQDIVSSESDRGLTYMHLLTSAEQNNALLTTREAMLLFMLSELPIIARTMLLCLDWIYYRKEDNPKDEKVFILIETPFC